MGDPHPDTFVCQYCGETVAWDEMRYHYVLSGIFGCVNKPTSVIEENMFRERLKRHVVEKTDGAEWLWDKDAYLAQIPVTEIQRQIVLLKEMVGLPDQSQKNVDRWLEALESYKAELKRRQG